MNLKQTAYHEAGHAIVQWALDLGIKEVTIIPNDEKGAVGHSTHDADFDEDAMELGEECIQQRWAVINMAGHFAQSKLDSTLGDEGCDKDYLEAADHIEHLCYLPDDNENAAWWLVLQVRSKALVEHYWPEIEALAIELLERETLDGDEASELILQHIDARDGSLLG